MNDNRVRCIFRADGLSFEQQLQILLNQLRRGNGVWLPQK